MAMLGAKCSACCDGDGPCPCRAGQLPDTITVSLSGPMRDLDRPGLPLLTLSFASCFGSGAAGYAVAPGGKLDNRGPIESVVLTKQGSGYATLGREQPTITLGNANTEAAEVSFSYTQSSDKCGRPLWSISDVAVIDGGDGYTNAEGAALSLAAGTKGSGASGTIYTQRAEPVLEATASFGSGVTFTVAVEETGAEPPTWRVKSVTFEGEGKNYQDGDLLLISGSDVVTLEGAQAVIRATYSDSPPAVEVRPFGVSGDGATLSAVLSANGGTPPTWSVTAVSIDAAGTGYAPGDWFAVYNLDTGGFTSNDVFVEGVGENGEITAVALYPGSPLTSPPELDSVDLLSGGEYYGTTKILDRVEITNGGSYYAENTNLPPIVADVAVTIQQGIAGGFGAELSAVVDSDPASNTFGQITAVTIDDAGSNYLGFVFLDSDCFCEWNLDGDGDKYENTVVAWRAFDGPFNRPLTPGCSYYGFRCWPDGPREELRTSLLRARLSSDLKTAWVPVFGPWGKPGRDGGPISLDSELLGIVAQELKDWAYVDTETNQVVAPPITVAIEQAIPSAGSGAEITATIDTDPESETFGEVTLEMQDGGDGYLGQVNGGSGVYVYYRGPRLPPVVEVFDTQCDSGDLCGETLTTDTLIDDCSNFRFTATFGEGTAEVSPGGSAPPLFEGPNKCCGHCYNACPDRPSQVTVTISRESASGATLKRSNQVPGVAYPELPYTFGDNLDQFDFEGEGIEVECPAENFEIVFDIEDLERERDCGEISACVGSPPTCDQPQDQEETTTSEANILTMSNIGFVYDPNPERWVLTASPESVSANVTIRIFKQYRGPNPCPTDECFYFEVAMSSSWNGPGATNPEWGGHQNYKTTIYRQEFPTGIECDDELTDCADYKVWTKTEQSGVEVTGDLPGVERGAVVDVGDLYWSRVRFFREWTETETDETFALLLERVCPHYELDVEFS